MGLSGVGKTRLSRVLSRDSWFHYSVDYRIWTHYLGDQLSDYVKQLAMQHPLLREMLRRDAITVEHRVHIDNLLATAYFMGMLGNPKELGSTLKDFSSRMAMHAEAEKAAMLDIPAFVERAQKLYQYPHFMADLSGSLCEIVDVTDPDDPVLQMLDDSVTLIYICATQSHTALLTKRNNANPKPMYYRPNFIAAEMPKLLTHFNVRSVENVSPKEVGAFLYPRLLAHRVERYEAIAAKHAVTLTMEEAAAIQSEADLLALLGRR